MAVSDFLGFFSRNHFLEEGSLFNGGKGVGRGDSDGRAYFLTEGDTHWEGGGTVV